MLKLLKKKKKKSNETKKAIGLQDISLCKIGSASRHEFRNGGLSFIQIHASGWVKV